MFTILCFQQNLREKACSMKYCNLTYKLMIKVHGELKIKRKCKSLLTKIQLFLILKAEQ